MTWPFGFWFWFLSLFFFFFWFNRDSYSKDFGTKRAGHQFQKLYTLKMQIGDIYIYLHTHIIFLKCMVVYLCDHLHLCGIR